jgi:hypothetical protein
MGRDRSFKFAAYHEAGHAVLADSFGVLIEVRLEPTPVTRSTFSDQDVACCINYGGVLAQAKYQRRSALAICLTDGHQDLEYIGQVAAFRARALGWNLENEFAKWYKVARKILYSRWPAVRLVASSLLEKGHLDARRVRELVTSARLCGP